MRLLEWMIHSISQVWSDRDRRQEQEEEASLDLLLSETRDMVIRQLETVDALDTKAGLLLGFDGLIITSAVGQLVEIVASRKTVSSSATLCLAVTTVLLGFAAVLVSFILAAVGFRIRTYQDVLNPESAFDKWRSWTEVMVKQQLRANLADGFKTNLETLARKAKCIGIALWSLLAGLVLFVLAAVLYAFLQ